MLKGLAGVNYYCWRKIPIKGRKKAKEVARRMTVKHHEKFNHYKCKFCDSYHVGRANKWGKKY